MYNNPFNGMAIVYFFDKLRALRAKWSGEQIVVRLPAGATKTIRVRVGERFIAIGQYLLLSL
jgi:hypothetical protein